jgi:hypothetical protein
VDLPPLHRSDHVGVHVLPFEHAPDQRLALEHAGNRPSAVILLLVADPRSLTPRPSDLLEFVQDGVSETVPSAARSAVGGSSAWMMSSGLRDRRTELSK